MSTDIPVHFATDHHARITDAAEKLFDSHAKGMGGTHANWAREQLNLALRDARNAGTGVNTGLIKDLVERSVTEGNPELFRTYLQHRANPPVVVPKAALEIAEPLGLSPQIEHLVEHQPSLAPLGSRADQLAHEALSHLEPKEIAASTAKSAIAGSASTAIVPAGPLVHHDVMGGPLRPAVVAQAAEASHAATRIGIGARLRAGVSHIGNLFKRTPAAVVEPVIEAASPTIHLSGPLHTMALVPAGPLVHHDVLGGQLRSAATVTAAAESAAQPVAAAVKTASKPGFFQEIANRFKRPSSKMMDGWVSQAESASRGSKLLGGAIMASAVAALAVAGFSSQREQERRASALDAIQR